MHEGFPPLVIEAGHEHHLDGAAARFALAEEAGGEDLRVVQEEQVAGFQASPDVADARVDDSASLAVQDQEP
jgi:hypothetical protein